jgi:peptidoglycan/LPS O-acetylase OafA/YrhL
MNPQLGAPLSALGVPSRTRETASPPGAGTGTQSGRQPILDGVRAAAALLVFLGHATIIPADPGVNVTIDVIWSRMASLNGLGAIMFFILSGYLVTEVLLKSDRDPKFFFGHFYARRALRLLPLYFIVVIFSLVILPNLPGSIFPVAKLQRFGQIHGDEWLYATGLSNFAVQAAGKWRHGILDPTWSLAIEFQFYLIWPVAVYFLRRRGLLVLCILMIVFSSVFRALAAYSWDWNPISIYVSSWSRIGAFGFGGVVSLVLRDPELLRRLRPWATAAALSVLPLIWASMAFEDYYLGPDQNFSKHGLRGGKFTYSILNTITQIGIVGLMLWCMAATPTGILATVFCSEPLRRFAKYSYAFFLFHLPIRAAVRDVFFGFANEGNNVHPKFEWFTVWGSYLPAQLVYYVLAFGASFGAAWVTWHMYEKHWLRFNVFFPSRPNKPPATPTSQG